MSVSRCWIASGVALYLLRYLNPESSRRLREKAKPQMVFNYLGRFSSGGGDWSPVDEALRSMTAPSRSRQTSVRSAT